MSDPMANTNTPIKGHLKMLKDAKAGKLGKVEQSSMKYARIAPQAQAPVRIQGGTYFGIS